MKYFFIAGVIIFTDILYGMRDVDDFVSKKSVKSTVIMSSTPDLTAGQDIEVGSEDDFSDTSSSTVDVDKLLPLNNANINELIRQEISPDVYGVTTLKIDFAKVDKIFATQQDTKTWRPPIIPFGCCSEASETQEETCNDGNAFEFAF